MAAPLAYKYLYHRWAREPRHWYPLLAVHYLTYHCDFRCPYCSDGAERPYYRLRSPVLEAERSIELLRAIRRNCAHVVLTGGEPTKHPQFAEVMRELPRVGFSTVILTTNGYELDRYLDVVAGAVTELVVSVDTLNRAKADACFGVGEGTLERILANVEEARRVAGSKLQIVISSVVKPDNLDDLGEVYEWARSRGFLFAACPQLVGVKAHASLPGNPAYRAFFDRLASDKRRGEKIYGTVPYLEAMRDLPKFRCYPFTMLVVSPSGEVFYPCLEIGKPAGNLLEEELDAILANGRAKFGPQPECDVRCHSACALSFSVLLSQPSTLIQEAYLQVKSRLGE